jgi:ADP-ribosylglycohydrolase
MTHPEAPDLDSRRRGFLAGAVIGAALAARTASLRDATDIAAALADGPQPLAAPSGQRYAAVALGDALLEELLSGGVDLQRLAGRWVQWLHEDGWEADAALRASLAHLNEFNAPAVSPAQGGSSALAAALPAALAAASPRTMVSGAFHTARLVDPDPESGLAAVALVLAAARFLEGSRDFLPDVLGLLRSNGAEATVIDRFAAIARDPRAQPIPPRGQDASALDVAIWALRIAQHRPRSVEALTAMVGAGGVGTTAGAALGALLGARDGIEHWPQGWREGAGEDVRLRLMLADRLRQADRNA